MSNAGPVRAYACFMSESPHPHKPVRMLVCGEHHRGDDAAALLAAGRLAGAAAFLVDVIEVGQLSVEALLDVPESVAVIVADAAVGVAAGQVVTLPLSEVARRGAGATPASSHSLPPDQVLALAEEIRGSPLRGRFVGIGGAEFGFGERLSPAVEAAMPAFTEALAGAIRSLSDPLP
jgi:hydrogenase maturation protease